MKRSFGHCSSNRDEIRQQGEGRLRQTPVALSDHDLAEQVRDKHQCIRLAVKFGERVVRVEFDWRHGTADCIAGPGGRGHELNPPAAADSVSYDLACKSGNPSPRDGVQRRAAVHQHVDEYSSLCGCVPALDVE